jgi:hypothetical protein
MTTTGAAEQQEQVIHAQDYLRVSLDRSGRARSLDEQHAEHRQVAAERGWALDRRSLLEDAVDGARRNGDPVSSALGWAR